MALSTRIVLIFLQHVLVQLIQQGLDDHVIGLVHVELDLGPGVAVGHTQL